MDFQKTLTFEEKVIFCLSPLTAKKIILACSGGPDSMVLLEMLRLFYGADLICRVVIAHIHHGLRKSADRDEEIVQNYCKQYNLTYEGLKAHINIEAKKTKTSIEECARNIRKEWLETIRKKYEADYILTAHHADDQAETLLYRITKGTSITGLAGIPEYAGYYFRPLLRVSKKEILEYAKDYTIQYGLDETNDDTTLSRNLLRNLVLPELKTINPEVGKSLERLSESARELREGFDNFFAEYVTKGELNYDWYHTLPLGFQHELLRILYEKSNGSTHGLSLALILELDRFLSNRTGGKKELGKKWLTKKHGKIYLT